MEAIKGYLYLVPTPAVSWKRVSEEMDKGKKANLIQFNKGRLRPGDYLVKVRISSPYIDEPDYTQRIPGKVTPIRSTFSSDLEFRQACENIRLPEYIKTGILKNHHDGDEIELEYFGQRFKLIVAQGSYEFRNQGEFNDLLYRLFMKGKGLEEGTLKFTS